MKKFILILFTIILSIFPITIYSHSGRTDANGGHWDRSTGTYHYHNNGYVQKNNTYSAGGINSIEDLEQGKKEYIEKKTQKSTYATPAPAPTEKIVSNITSENNNTDIAPIQKTKNSEVILMEIIFALLAVIILILLYIIFLLNKNKVKDKSKSKINETEPLPNPQQNTSNEKTSDTSHKRASSQKKTTTRKTSKMKWRNKMLDISMIPKTVELDKDTLLPQSLKREYGYGRRFNAFITDDCSYYHRSKCAKIKGQKKQCIHRYLALHKINSCPDCTPNNYIDEWYIEFLEKNFNKFTTYYDFQKWAELPNIKLPDEKDILYIENNAQE